MTQLRPEHIDRHLNRGLASVYLVAGDEPLLVEETLTALRRAARAQGFDEREVLHADGNFDWSSLRAARDNLSLFSERRLVEVRLPGGKPGTEGSRVLKEYAADPPADVLLVVICGRLDSGQRRAAWVTALEKAGAMVYGWPVRRAELPAWMMLRLRAAGLQPTEEAVDILVERAEGNLMAAAQEVEKLQLITGGGALDGAAVRDAVTNTARFDAFDLPAAARAGDRGRVLRVARALREEGEQPTLVLWALARDVRVLAELQAVRDRREAPDGAFKRHRIWRNQQAAYWQLATATAAGRWDRLLTRAAAVDAVIKGAAPGRAWDELLHLAVAMAALAEGSGAGGRISNG